MGKTIDLNRWYMDLFFVPLAIALNPITHYFNYSPRMFSPDTIAYMTMGRDLFAKGLLYIPSWAHVYNDLVYPPLYPFFIAFVKLFSQETLNTAEWVSSICVLMASILIYLYVREMANRVVAFITVLLVQINYYYFFVGMRPLSEATFLLALCGALFLTLKFLRNWKSGNRLLPILVGLACGLVFLSRQIGALVFVFLAIMSLLQGLTSVSQERRIILRNFLFILAGLLLVIAPYTLTIYYQSGHHPFGQNFRRAGYEATTANPRVLAEIKQIEDLPSNNYGMIYAKRRLMRKLLPDSSEMYQYVNREERAKNEHMETFLSSFKNPKDYMTRVYNNIIYFRETLGWFTLSVFLILCLTPFILKSTRLQLLNRLSLPCFIVLYLLAISGFKVQVPRYIYVLFPFILMHISAEIFICFQTLPDTKKIMVAKLVSISLVYVLILLATPKFFTALKVYPKPDVMGAEFHSLRKHINGEPVFTLFPFQAYLSGGSIRLLPNDSLEKVVNYGRKTGVRWLLLIRTQSAKNEMRFYINARWYWNPSLENDYPNLVRFCCGSGDRRIALYEIL